MNENALVGKYWDIIPWPNDICSVAQEACISLFLAAYTLENEVDP